jgi:two-component system sensor histidine kinase UhpB
MRSLSVAVLEGIHKLIVNLRPTVLDDLGLAAAIRASSETRLADAGIKLHLEADYEERLPITLETALFRVIQEAVNNIIRHSKAENASIELVVDDSTIAVDVEDDGIGFVTDNMFEIRESGQGLGLLGMQERVSLLGGTMSINSQPANGTHLAIRVPLDRKGN